MRNEGQLVSHGSLNTDLQKLDNADGQIAAAGSATLTAKELDNQKGQVVAQGNLTLDTDTLNNRQGSALAGQALAIEAEAVDNQAGTLAAGGAITAKVTNALNNDGGLVEAGGHLDVQADSLSNTKGRLRALGSAGESRFTIGKQLNNDDGLLEVGSAVLTFDTESLSNKDGVVRHLGSAGLNLDMQLLGQAGGEFITNSAVSLSAEEWVNDSLLQAASITLDIDRLTQTAGGGLLAVNSLSTTGESWINDGRLETNGNLDLRLSGDYRGNGSLLALGNIDLQADNIAFGTDAKVSGGGFGRLTALGELVSQGRMTAAAWLSMAAEKIDNRGTLGAGGDLLLQADSIRNDGGLIFSGGNLQLLADRFTNRLASLYSLGHLSIAKDAQGSLASLIENRSGTFDSAGDMSLRAAVIANVRDEFQTEQGKYDAVFTELACRGPYNPTGDCKLGSNGRKVGVWQLQEYDRLIVTADSGASHITAGGSLNVLGDRLTNSSSTIAAAGDLQMQLGSLDNIGVETSEVHTTRILVSGRKPSYWFYRGLVYGFNAEHAGSRNLGTLESDLNRVVGAMEREYLPANKVEQVSVDGQTYAAVIQSGGDIKVNTRDDFDSRVIRSSYAYVGGGTRVDTSTPGSDIATAITLNPQLPPDLAQKAVDPLSLPSFKLPVGKNGLFSLNTTPGHPYLIETDPAFADLGNFLSSSYLLGELDYDPNNTQKLLGDGLFEQRLIRDAVLARTGQRFLAGLTSDEAQFRYLMDNAIASQEALQLSVGVGLSAEQVAALTHDIVWMEEREVSGQKVLAPVLYLAQADGRLAPNGALVQGRDLTLISGGGLSNAGTLRATANLGIQAESIGNSGLMQANQRLQLLATDSIRNAQGGIIAGRDVSLQAGNDILNERSVATHQSANGKAYEHQRQMADSAARIEAERDLSMVAGRDLLNVGGALSAGGNATLQAGQDLLLASQQTENSTSRYQNARNYSTRQQIDQYGSDVKVGGDLQAVAARDMAIVGSKVAAEGDMALQAGGSMTIASAANEYHYDAKRKGGGKKVEAVQDSVTQIASELSAGGDLRAVSGQDMNLSASRIDAGGSAYLYSGGQLNLLAAQNSNYSLYDKQSKGSFGAKATRRDEVTTIRHIGTEITTGSDLTLASIGDQRYQRARLDSGADLTLQSGGGITFEGVKDLDQKSFEKSSNSLVWTSTKGKGTTDETLLQTQMIAQGEIVIKAVEGLNIDIKDVDRQTVTQTIDAMVEADPQLAWLKAAEQRGDVDWHRVKEIHDSFKYSHSGLGGGAAIVIAIIVAYFTAGAASGLIGSAAGAGAGSGSAMAAAGSSAMVSAGTAVGTASAGWANVALTAVATSAASGAAISTVNNRGNLGAVFKDVTSSDALKGYMVAGATAGLTAGLYDSWTGTETTNTSTSNAVGANTPLSNSGTVSVANSGSSLSTWSGVGRFAANQALQNSTSAALSKLVGQDGSFSDALQSTLANTFMAAGFNWIGDNTAPGAKLELENGSLAKAGLHAVMGGLTAEAMGGDFKTGALAAGVNELLVEKLDAQYQKMGIEDRKTLLVMNSQLVGVFTAGLQGGDEQSLQVASAVAGGATSYNWLLHEEIRAADKAREGCAARGGDVAACQHDITKAMDQLDQMRNMDVTEHGRAVQQQALEEGWSLGEYNDALDSYWNGIDKDQLVLTGYAPAQEWDYRLPEFGSGVVEAAKSWPSRVVDTIVGLKDAPAKLAQAPGQAWEWISSPIPAHNLERAGDQMLFSTPDQVGGIAFDATTGAITSWVGGRLVEWVGGKWVASRNASASANPPYTSTYVPDAEAGMPVAGRRPTTGKVAEAIDALEQTKKEIPFWTTSEGPYSGQLAGYPKPPDASYGGRSVEAPSDYSGQIGAKGLGQTVGAGTSATTLDLFSVTRGKDLSKLNNQQVGDLGEDISKAFLRDNNHTDIFAMQNRSGNGIDIVSRTPDGRLAFTEVKTSRTGNVGDLSVRQQNMTTFIEDVLGQAASRQGRYKSISVAEQQQARQMLREFRRAPENVSGNLIGVDLQGEVLRVSPWARN
ncbi:DUF637 domain-containing protein [Pseudomonas sp. PDM11]|uniref:DUF637 domain-containing protein n=1 Tax=Pseudomonas sp. PDM11 TaxID=2769309 RepID=UPI00298C4763|nr:DUF637 domain-containing protein [Pseudomonas sp. PDM11]